MASSLPLLVGCGLLLSCSLSTSCAQKKEGVAQPGPAAATAAQAKPAADKAAIEKKKVVDEQLAAILKPRKLGPPPGLSPRPGKPATATKKAVTVSGIAHDARMGAIVKTDQGNVYYIGDLSEWPPTLLNKRVEVKGTVTSRKLAPDPVVDKNGAVSAGMYGSSNVITGATWKLLP